MNININTYGDLCSLCYDLRLSYAPKAEVDFFASSIDKKPGRTLEVMSGSGRLLIPLLQRGYTVDGADCSPAMLKRCKARCATLQLIPELYEQSLESLAISHQYATVIIALASFQLIFDRAQALQSLKNIYAHMLEQGNLLIDIFMPDATDEESSVSIIPVGNGTHIKLTKKYTFDLSKQIAQALCTYKLIVDGIVQQTEQEMLQVVWYSDAQWADLLAQAGFKIIKIYDNPFGKEETARVIHTQKV